jgi:hypothetical protein
MSKLEELWVTNASLEKDVSIGDLGVTIRRGQSINLLAKKNNGKSRYMFSREQIDASIKNGSIAKNDLLKVRKVAPLFFSHRIDIIKKEDPITKTKLNRKATEIEAPEFPDLDFEDGSDEEFALNQADMDLADKKPLLNVDPRFDD